MAKRTLTTIWQQIEKMYQQLIHKRKTSTAIYTIYNELVAKEDVKQILQDILAVLTQGISNTDEIILEFESYNEESNLENLSSYDPKTKILIISPFAVLNFAYNSKELNLENDETQQDFDLFRRLSFTSQLSKLPSKLFLFLMIFRQISISNGITHIGLSEAPEELDDIASYQTLLWSFSQLENKISHNLGENIRIKYGVIWHESSWIKDV